MMPVISHYLCLLMFCIVPVLFIIHFLHVSSSYIIIQLTGAATVRIP
jgi:hypothetical protein